MDTFKVIYKNNSKYFRQDYVRNISLEEIEFSKKKSGTCDAYKGNYSVNKGKCLCLRF